MYLSIFGLQYNFPAVNSVFQLLTKMFHFGDVRDQILSSQNSTIPPKF